MPGGGQEIGNFQVNIQAKITGYQSSIENLKKQLAVVGENTDIGKNLSKQIADAEKKLANLSKNSEIQIKTGTGLDKMREQLDGMDRAIANIGKQMQTVTIADIDTSKLDQATQEIKRQIDDLQQQVQVGIGPAFQQVIERWAADSSKSFSAVMDTLKIDPSELNADNFTEVLSGAIEQVRARVQGLREEISDLTAQRAALGQSKEGYARDSQLSAKDVATSAVARLREIGDTTGLSSTAEVQINHLRDTFNRAFSSMNEEGKQKLNEIFDEMAQSSSLKEFQQKVQKLRELLTAQPGLNKTEINRALEAVGGSPFDQLFKLDKFKGANTEALEQVRGVLRDVFGSFEEFKDPEALNAQVESLLSSFSSGSVEGINAVTEAIRLYIETTSKLKGNEAAEAMEKTEEAITSRQAEVDKLNSTNKQANGYVSAGKQEISKLQSVIDEQKKKIDELQKQVDTLAEQVRSGVAGAGAAAEESGDQGLRENAEAAAKISKELDQANEKKELLGSVENIIRNWFSVYAAVRMIGQAFNEIKSTLKDLDKTITEIAIVTNMTQSELWGQMSTYTSMAREYAASISGVYQVSQLYYQQGLQTADVMALTEQTLKMARISGLDYAKATDYMTNAVRSFKMEMTDAQRVVDVYSALAASAATNVEELAVAMSKTASSAEAVGSSFENTSAMMAVMIEATRESSQNIGSALKSIISRYGELKTNPAALVDSEGEELSLNKVDTALQTVGISIHDAQGQFRDFDDVIMDLAKSWGKIDVNTQRYIATIMAGNRQQSRFLALVSNYERLSELSETAANSEDASQMQFLKTLDSIEAKSQQLQTGLQSLYTSAGLQELYKGILDMTNAVIGSLNEMTIALNNPIGAITTIGTRFYSLASIARTVFQLIKGEISLGMSQIFTIGQTGLAKSQALAQQDLINWNNNEQSKVQASRASTEQRGANEEALKNRNAGTYTQDSVNYANSKGTQQMSKSAMWGLGLNIGSIAFSAAAANLKNKNDEESQRTGGILSAASTGMSAAAMLAPLGPAAMVAGGAIGTLIGVFNNLNLIVPDTATRLRNATKAAEEANNAMLMQRNSSKSLQNAVQNLQKLSDAQYDSVEAQQAYLEASNALADQYPELIQYYDETGNAIVDLTAANQMLSQSLAETTEKTIEAAGANYQKALLEKQSNQETTTKTYDELQTVGDMVAAFTAITEGHSSEEQDDWHYFINDAGQIESQSGSTYTNFLEMIQKGSFSNAGIIKTPEGYEEFADLVTEFGHLDLQAGPEVFVEWYNRSLREIQRMSEEGNEAAQFASRFFTDMFNALKVVDTAQTRGQTKVDAAARTGILTTLSSSYNQAKQFSQPGDNATIIQEAGTGLYEAMQTYALAAWDQYVDGLDREATEQEFTAWLTDNGQFDNLSEEFISLYQSGDKEAYDLLMSQRDQISKKEFLTRLTEIFPSISEEMQDAFLAHYDNTYSQRDFDEAINNTFTDDDLIGNQIRSFFRGANDAFSGAELQVILAHEKQINRLVTAGSWTETQGRDYINFYQQVWGNLQNITDTVLREQAQGLLRVWDGSREGLEAIKQTLIDAGRDINSDPSIEAINQLIEQLPINLNTMYQTIYSSIGKATKDFNTDIGKLSKGVSADEAVELANKYGLELNDFQLDYSTGLYAISDISEMTQRYFDSLDSQLVAAREAHAKITGGLQQNTTLSNLTIADAGSKSAEEILSAYDNEVFNTMGLKKEDVEGLLNLFLASGSKDSFLQWVTNYYQQLGESTAEAIANTKARGALQLGNVAQFVTEALGKKLGNINITKGILKAVTDSIVETGEISEKVIREKLAARGYDEATIQAVLTQMGLYTNFVSDTLGDVAENTISQAIGVLKSGKAVNIRVNQANRGILKRLVGTVGENGTTVQLTQAALGDIDAYNTIRQIIYDTFSDDKEALEKALGELEATKPTDYDTLNSIISAGEDGFGEVLRSQAIGLGLNLTPEWDEAIKAYRINPDELREVIKNDANLGRKQKNALLASLDKQTRETSKFSAFKAIGEDYTSIEEEAIEQLANALDQDYDTVKSIFTENGDGTYRANLSQLMALRDRLSLAGNEAAVEVITKVIDSYIEELGKIGTIQTQGYTKLSDMRAIASQFGESINSIFRWDDELRAYVLNTSGIVAQAQYMKQQLSSVTGRDQEIINQLINGQKQQLADNIDAIGYLTAIQTGNQGLINKAANEFARAINDYQAFCLGIGEGIIVNARDLQQLIANGGRDAILAAGYIASLQGKELSGEDIEKFYRGQVQPFINATEQLTLSVGSVIDETTAGILQQAGYSIELLGGGKAVITSAGNLVDAQKALYDTLKETNEATLAELNNLYAQYYSSSKGNFDALSNAGGMSYDTLAQIATDAGLTLEALLSEEFSDLFEDIGGKIQVKNFDFFAKEILGITDTTSQAYVDAFRSYNDTIISGLNARKNNIKSEIEAISQAKDGELINVGQFYSAFMNEPTVNRYALNNELSRAGAIISNGILELGTANISSILEIFKRYGKQANLSDIDLKVINDAIISYVNTSINNVSNLISKQKSGYTDIGEISSLAETYGMTVSEMFKWDNDLNAYVVSQQGIGQAVLIARQNLDSLDRNSDEYAAALRTLQAQGRQLADNIDFTRLVNSIGTTDYGDAILDFEEAVENYNAFLAASGKQIRLNTADLIKAAQRGGKDAVAAAKAIAKTTGKELTGEDIEGIYRQGANRINQALDQIQLSIGSVIDQSTVQLLGLSGKVESIGGGKYVITSTINMVDAYLKLHNLMQQNDASTLTEINALQVKILTEMGGRSKATIDALGSAASMSYDTLAAIAEDVGMDLMTMLDKLGTSVEYLGGDQIRITDFRKFAKEVGFEDTTSELYIEALSAYNDSLIEAETKTTESIISEITAVSEAHVGDKVNVSHLYSLFGKDIPVTFIWRLSQFGADIKNGILTINSTEYLGQIVALLQEAAEATGQLTEREIAELQDAAQNLITAITDSIKQGIEGTLTNVQKVDLKESLKQYGVSLDDSAFVKTVNGWQLTQEAATQVYLTMREIDALQGSLVLDALRESLVEANGEFSTMSTMMRSLAQDNVISGRTLERRRRQNARDQGTLGELASLNGNVDMFTRPHVRNADGSYSTVHTATYAASQFVQTSDAPEAIRNFPYVLNVTPITQDGRELSPDEIDDYVYELIQQSGGDIDEALRLDASESGKKLIIQWSQINTENLTNEQLLEAANQELETMGEHAEHIHEISDSMEPLEAREISALQEQRDLLQEMAMLRATSKDEGFAFMDAKLPEAMENPLTYAENWGKAIDILTKQSSGTKKGFIDARDWYNIVNEMNNIAAVSGQSLTLFGETLSGKATDAANLIEKGFNNLKSIDGGKMQVDLRATFSGIGSAFEQGATDAHGSITEGIHEMAQSQIDMLDGLIAMLETIVAMQDAFDGLAASDDGKLEFGELFTFDSFEGGYLATSDMQTAATRLRQLSKDNQILANALEQIKIDGESLGHLLSVAEKGYSLNEGQAKALSAALSAFYQAMQSGNYDLDNIYESVKQVLQESGVTNGSVSIDIGTTTLYLTGNVITQIDWNSTQVKEALKNAYNGRSKNGKSPKEQAEAAMEALSKDPGSLLGAGHENDLKFVLQTNTDVTYNAKTKTYTVDGHSFTDEKEAYKALLLKQTSNKTKITVDSSGKLTGAVIEGEAGAKVEMTINSEGNISYKYVGPGGDYGEGATPQEAIRNYYSAHPNQLPDNLSLDDVVHKTSVELGVESSTGITFGEIDEKTGKVVERKPTAEESRKAMALLNDPTLTTYQDLRDKADELGLPIHIDTSLQGPFDIATLQSLAEKLGGEYKLEAKTLSLNVDTSNIPEGWVKLIEGQKLEIATDLESLNDVTTEGLQAVIDALTQVYDKAVQLQNFDWADLKNKLNIFGPSGEGEGEDGETTQPGFVDVTINPIAEKGLLDLIYGETLERNLVVNVQKKGDNLNPTQTENNDNKNQKDNKESNDNSGAALGEANTGGLQAAVDAVNSIATDKGAAIQNTTDALNALPDQSNLIKRLSGSIDKIQDRSGRIDNLVQSINNLPSNKEIALEISMKIKATADVKFNTEGNTPSGPPGAKGNIEISNEQASVESLNPSKKKIKITGKKKSKAKGTSALAGGTNKTLMGELGPELVVTDNMYHVVGESGAEFVDLPNDAIVFNHLLTKKLLKNGHAGRGKPITNERNAVAFAKGNGPAMASAAQALAALKQLRAMWASMLNASAKDLGSQAGRGGGGGGKEDNDKYKQPTNVTAEIQRWYNWLRQIDRIEQDITYQEALQKKYESDRIANGLKIYQTQKAQYDLLGEEIKRNQKLAELQKSWYDNKRAELAASSYGKIFTYDENGLQQYVGTGKPGSGLGLDILENLTRRNVKGEYTGHAVSAKEQLKYLASVGFKLNDLIYNDDGTKVAQKVTQSLAIQRIQDDESSDDEIFTQMMDNFWNNVDGWRDELDSLYDSYREQLTNIEENQTKQYEIIQKFVENELDVENKLLEAIEAREQAVIDKLTEQKEALQKSTDRFIKGLNDQLDKEKQMQEDNKKDEELTKLQRQLAILQRSGGSASQIKSLQDQIASKQQDAYYDGRQEEIDAIKDATDKQLEKLDKQIELLTETLEYQKENGLFWNEVRELMAGPEDVATAFYDKYVTSKSGQSALQQSEDVRSFKESFQKWIGWREDKDKQAEKQAEMEDIANYETYAESNNKYLKGLTEDERSSAITRAETAAEEAKNQYLEDHKGEEGAEEGAKAAAAKAYNQSLEQSFINSEQNKEPREKFESGYKTWLKNRYAKYGDEDVTQKDAFKNNEAEFYNRMEADYLANVQSGMGEKEALEGAINSAEKRLMEIGQEDAKAAELEAALKAKANVYTINAKGVAKKTKTTIAKGTKENFTAAKRGKLGKKWYNFLYAPGIGYIPASKVDNGTEIYNKLKNAVDIADAAEEISALSDPLGTEAGENEYYDAAITKDIELSGLTKKQLKFSATKLQDKVTKKLISPTAKNNTIWITDLTGLKFNKKGKISKLSKVKVSHLNESDLQEPEWIKANKTIIKKLNAKFPNNDFKNYLKYLNKYKEGGLVDYTGLARVDGTPGRPEAFLNAEQTAFLKNDLLGHSSNSLMSIVSSLQDSINGTAVGNSNISNNNNNDNVVIENVDVTFEAGTISSDYDARRAGELFKEELVKMARKAGDRSVTRR